MDNVQALCVEIKNDKSFRYINSGGCCVFAALVGKALKAHDADIQTRFIVFGNANCNLDKVRQDINDNSVFEWENNGVHFSHVVVEFKYKNRWYTCDARRGVMLSNADNSYNCRGKSKGRLSLLEANALAADDDWNPAFHRSLIPRLEQVVNRVIH